MATLFSRGCSRFLKKSMATQQKKLPCYTLIFSRSGYTYFYNGCSSPKTQGQFFWFEFGVYNKRAVWYSYTKQIILILPFHLTFAL